MAKPYECRICGAPLEQRPRGRPRAVCSRPACQRRAEADTRRLRRRRLAGIAPSWLYDTPQPRGGHDPIARRIARQLASDYFPQVTPTEEELKALEAAIRLGATPTDLTAMRAGSIKGLPADLPGGARRALRRLAERNREASAPSSRTTPSERAAGD